MSESVLFSVFLIFTGAAIIATLALYTRQSLLLAYLPWKLECDSDR